MTAAPDHIAGHTVHMRRGAVANSFGYSVDYVLIDPEARTGPRLFSRNGFNLVSVRDRHHGGPRGAGRGVAWAREVLEGHGLDTGRTRILLLTQPAFLGRVFNPVSFWLAMAGDELRAVIAEVDNTFAERHCYLCHKPGFAPIGPADRLTSRKVFHVSPFQKVAGEYAFNFLIAPDRIAIRIWHRNGDEGVIATLSGPRAPLTDRTILTTVLLRRPFGALRTVALIYWQALKLKLKGAKYTTRPTPPAEEVS